MVKIKKFLILLDKNAGGGRMRYPKKFWIPHSTQMCRNYKNECKDEFERKVE